MSNAAGRAGKALTCSRNSPTNPCAVSWKDDDVRFIIGAETNSRREGRAGWHFCEAKCHYATGTLH